MAAGADDLEVNCNMAQAFEIPGETGQRILTPSRWAEVGHRRVPSNAFPDRRSRSDPDRIGTWEYGSAAGPPQALTDCPARPAAGPIPGSAIRAKVNRFCSI